MEETLETVILRFDEDTGIANLVLNRPSSLNALSGQLRSDIADSIGLLEETNEESDGVVVRAIVVEGAGERAFSAGADINEFTDDINSFFSICPARDSFENCLIPVIAKIDGYCLGGGFELAFAADIRLASERSEFGFPEVNHGILPAGGGIQYLTRAIGPARTMELLLDGSHFSPERAERYGLVNRVYPTDELDERVDELAASIASKPPLATRAIKDSVGQIYTSSIQDGREYDRGLSFMLKNTDDHRKAIAAFGEDRTPTFAGR